MVTVVLDAQAGSCGKGKFIGYLAKHDGCNIAINNFMSNAGHTFVDDDGTRIMTQHIPTSVVNKNASLIIGPEAAITPKILFDEVLKYNDLIGKNRCVIVHPRAVVIKDCHRNQERERLRSGSTFKGCGAARSDKIWREAELFGSWWTRFVDNNLTVDEMRTDGLNLYSDEQVNIIRSNIAVRDMTMWINQNIDNGSRIIVEGSQGCDLDINFGLDYPHTTSRQCHTGQLIADCGISPRLVDEIIMIIRPYPIRISNETNLKDMSGKTLYVSSGEYSGSEELTWSEIKRRCGAPDSVQLGEMTTVTKKTRRVFEMNWDRLRYVAKINRPTYIALNFAQYIDWDAYGYVGEFNGLPDKVKKFVATVERVTGVRVGFIGTGERNDQIVDARSIN